MYLVKLKDFDQYRTVRKSEAWKMKAFPNFKVIYNKEETKTILKEKFNSSSRGGDYNPDLPSVTQIVGDLYPIDFAKEYGLLKWFNNKTVVSHKEAKSNSKTACEKGTELHRVLEDCLIETGGIPAEGFGKYTQDKEILETLETFKNDQAGKIVKVHTELFIQTGYCQGTVDLLCEYEGRFTLADWKTTSKKNKSTGKGVFYSKSGLGQYLRQLSLYTIMLEDSGILSSKDILNMDYKIFQFHFLRKDYKLFEIEPEEVRSLESSILKVLGWYQENIR